MYGEITTSAPAPLNFLHRFLGAGAGDRPNLRREGFGRQHCVEIFGIGGQRSNQANRSLNAHSLQYLVLGSIALISDEPQALRRLN
jgi:hypothetical protein